MWWLILALLVVGGVVLRQRAVSAPRPDGLGVHEGALSPCPETNNCVSTTAEDPAKRMEAIRFRGSAAEAQSKLEAVLAEMRGATVVESRPGYVAAEFHLPVMGYIDDVEFLLLDQEKCLHFRSASRLGSSDLGVNRRRMEKVIQHLREAGAVAEAP